MTDFTANMVLKPVSAIVSHQYRINDQRMLRIAEGFAVRVPAGFQVAGLLCIKGLVVAEKKGAL